MTYFVLVLRGLDKLVFSCLSVPGFSACHNSKFVSMFNKQNKIKRLVKSILKKKKEKGSGHKYNGTNFCEY